MTARAHNTRWLPPGACRRAQGHRLWLLAGTVLLLAGSATVGSEASEYRETDDFAVAVEAAEAYADRFGTDATWFVADIDNTLLAMQGELGSDQWFEWQEYLLAQEPDSPQLVADDFPGLLDVQELLFMLGKMRPPQPDLPKLIERVQATGVPTLVLTSRGHEYRPATQRELVAAGYDFAGTAVELAGVPEGPFLPYDAKDPTLVGLTDKDLKLYDLAPEPRPVSLQEGVFMVAGQHKGAMLLTAVHRAKIKPRAVVFIDDHGRHVSRVYDAMVRHGIETTAVHYRREDANVSRFRYCDKRDVTARWRRLESALKEVFSLPEAGAPQSGKAHATADAHGAVQGAVQGAVPGSR